MKRILFLIALIVSLTASAQTPTGTKTRFPATWLQYRDTASATTADTLCLFTQPITGKLYYRGRPGTPWLDFGTSTGAGFINNQSGSTLSAQTAKFWISDTIKTSGNISAATANIPLVTTTTIGGTLSTAAQPNITSVGTLTNLTVSGNATIATISTTGITKAGGLSTQYWAADGTVQTVGNSSPFQELTSGHITTVTPGAMVSVTGDIVTEGNFDGPSMTVVNAGVSGSANIQSLNVLGNSILSGLLSVTGNTKTSSLSVTGNATIGGDLLVENDAQITGSLSVDGLSAGDISANNMVASGLVQTSAMSVSGGQTIGGNLTVTGSISSANFPSALSSYLPLAGGTMSGAINMGGQNITNGGAGTFTGNIIANNVQSTDGTVNTRITYSGGFGAVGTFSNHALGIYTNSTLRYTIDASGNNTWTGSGAFGGLITSTLGNSQKIFTSNSATTGYQYMEMTNTGASLAWGIERSTGGGLFTGTSAYSTVFGSSTNTSMHFITNNTVRYTIDGSGNNVWTGTGTIGGSSTSSRALLVNSVNANGSYIGLQNSGTDQIYLGNSAAVGGSFTGADLYVVSGGFRLYTGAALALTINSSQAATFVGSATSPTFYSNLANTNTVWAGNVGGANFMSGYWALRTSTNFNFNLDVYNSGSPITALTIASAGGGATFVSSVAVGGSSSPYGKFQVKEDTDLNFFTAKLGFTALQFGGIDDAGTNYVNTAVVGRTVSIYTTAGTGVTGTLAVGFGTDQHASFNATIATRGYTVATLPTGVTGKMCYVTDASAPTYGATVVGGGAVTIPVFYNGSNWICH